MAHLIQVGCGSGGMPVLDMVCREERMRRVTLIEPDIYKPHNVYRHLFPTSALGQTKARLAEDWLRQRRADLQIDVLEVDLLDPGSADRIDAAARTADLGVCAADNEPAKYHWDALMRRHGIPWTLGEVLSGGIGGFVHWFVPGGPCYGCVASHLKRSVQVDQAKAPDYSQPGGAVHETTLPASKAAIGVIAGLHAQITLQLLNGPKEYQPGFTSLLLTLEKVPGVFEEPFRSYRFQIARAPHCLICGAGAMETADLDAALDQALSRLDHA